MLPGDNPESVRKQLVDVLNDPQITLVPAVLPIQAPESPLTPEVVDKVARVVHGLWPDTPIIPIMATYFTDGRQFRNAGIPSYGANGVWKEESENRAHGKDERVATAAFDESVEFAYRLVKAFGGDAQR
jgi:acetylornithine deacetylase/succinyl-diaminopimelate desuccinylase-like protein